MIQPGNSLPLDLQFQAVIAGQTRTVTLADLLTRPTVVSVYMRNNTGACDKQTASLAAEQEAFDRAGYNLVALSRDTCKSHTTYAGKQGIHFALLADPQDLFSQAADAIVEKKMYGKAYQGPARAAYVLDRTGKVLAVLPKIDPANHAAELLALLKTLK